MRTITALELQKRNKERVNVYLDGEYAFSVTALQAFALRKGQPLSDEEIAALRGEDAVAKAVDSAARFLAHRPRSEAEVRRNLTGKAVDAPVVEAAVARLRAMGYLDDQAFARFWVQNRVAFRPLGPSALRYELRQKGVADADIEAVLRDLDTAEDAYRAASAQARRLRGLDERAFRAKIGSFLQRRGFPYPVIQEALNRLVEDLGEAAFRPAVDDDDGLAADEL